MLGDDFTGITIYASHDLLSISWVARPEASENESLAELTLLG
jgi:hypothetical protein